MKAAGWSLSEIAKALQLGDAGSVMRLLDEQYKQDAAFLTEDERHSLLAMEFGRLEKLIKANWASAEYGDPKCADIVLKAMAMQIKLARLDVADSSSQQAQVLVVGGLEQDYVAKLKTMAEGS